MTFAQILPMGILREDSDSTNRPDRFKQVWPEKGIIEAQPFGQLLKGTDEDWKHTPLFIGVEGIAPCPGRFRTVPGPQHRCPIGLPY